MLLDSDRKFHSLKCLDSDTGLRYRTLPEAVAILSLVQQPDSVTEAGTPTHVFDKNRSQLWMSHVNENQIPLRLRSMKALRSHANDLKPQSIRRQNDSAAHRHPSDPDQMGTGTPSSWKIVLMTEDDLNQMGFLRSVSAQLQPA